MLHLNDDCLEHICKQLALKDQISIRKVCRRLDRIILSLWRLDCKNVTMNLELDNEEFLDFMSAISNTVEDIKFDTIPNRQLQLLQGLHFPKVIQLDWESLRFDNDYNNENEGECIGRLKGYTRTENSDDDIVLLMSQLFPNLQTLKIFAPVTGKYIERFTQVTNLELTRYEFLETLNIEAIVTTLRLRKFGLCCYYDRHRVFGVDAILQCITLEELKITTFHLFGIVEEVLKMPNLKKVTCYNCNDDIEDLLIHRITNYKAEQIEMFIIKDKWISNDALEDNLSKMVNIKKLVFYNDYIEGDLWVTLSGKLKNLQHLCILKCELESSAALCTLSFVESCKDLRILDISGNQEIDNNFVWKIVEMLKKQTYRQLRLELRCFDTNIDEDLFKLNDNKYAMNFLWLNKTECENELKKDLPTRQYDLPEVHQFVFLANNESQ